MFAVYENDKPADPTGYPNLKLECWKTSKFNTLTEATQYLLDYFYPHILTWEGTGKVEFTEGCFAELREE